MKASELIPQLLSTSESRRESNILAILNKRYIAPHCLEFKPITVKNNKHVIVYFAALDYLAVGDTTDWLLTPMYPGTAQSFIDSTAEFSNSSSAVYILPTKLMVDQIYKNADARLAPVTIAPKKGEPGRGATETYVKHNSAIMRQRANCNTSMLVAGHKKDIVLTNMLLRDKNKVAIYGWHTAPGQPIQPLTTIHSDTYVDYSHGVRLISVACLVDGISMSITSVLMDKELAPLLNSEGPLKIFRYGTAT